MPPIIPDKVPKVIVAGATVKFHRAFGDYLASDGWGYVFYANGAANIFQIAATVNPDLGSFDIVIPASLTAPIAAGRYQCAEVLTNTGTGEVVHPNDDMIELWVEANVATASAGAFITHIERMIVIIEAALEGRLTADLETYQLAGRSISKIPAKELLWFRGHYRSKLYQLQNPGRLGAKAVVAFTIEDDEQNGPDHVDAHRAVGLVVSPYCKRAFIDSTLYTTASMVRTMELILGLPPLTQYDAGATPMFNCFQKTVQSVPYRCLTPQVDVLARNTNKSPGAEASARMDFRDYDLAPEDQLKRILWLAAKGPGAPYPTPIHGAILSR